MSVKSEQNQTVETLAENLLRELSSATAQNNLLKAKCDKEILNATLAIEAKYEAKREAPQKEIKRLEKAFQSLMRQYQGEFTEGQKERMCEFGSYGWRFGGDTLKIESMELLGQYVMEKPTERKDCGVFKFMPNKQGIKLRLQAGESVAGCWLGGSNRSFYELSKIGD